MKEHEQSQSEKFFRRIRSFVRRDGRMTPAQCRAVEEWLPQYGLVVTPDYVDFTKVFARQAPVVLEIGFGTGHSLLETAIHYPEIDFIGIETHLPGVGSLLGNMALRDVKNIRVYHADAVEVLSQAIPAKSLTGAQIFFPDPWPKRKHIKRRLIQPAFLELLVSKLKLGGWLHLATDWEDYAVQMMQVLSAHPALKNRAGEGCYAERSANRPVITRFEARGKQAGRLIRELDFEVSLD